MTEGWPLSMRSLVPLFASAVITLGEGSIQVVRGPYLELRGLSAAVIGTVTMTYAEGELTRDEYLQGRGDLDDG